MTTTNYLHRSLSLGIFPGTFKLREMSQLFRYVWVMLIMNVSIDKINPVTWFIDATHISQINIKLN